MERKLYKKELELWKEVTKEDIKINRYIQEDETETKNDFIKKKHEVSKQLLKSNKKKNSFTKKEGGVSSN